MNPHFYNELAAHYHLLYEDWDQAILKQGLALASLLEQSGVKKGETILDAASGIGTQTIGLLNCGYKVRASDLSPKAIERLRQELDHRTLHAEVHVDDLRTLEKTASASMAAVLACDNSIPHLLSDNDLLQAFRNCLRCLRPDGIAIFSVRDYAAIERKNPDVRPYGLRRDGDQRFIAVQVWEWFGDQYDLRIYLTTESPEGICETKVLKSRYYAVSTDRLLELLAEAGFINVARRDDVLFQPVILGRRPPAV